MKEVEEKRNDLDSEENEQKGKHNLQNNEEKTNEQECQQDALERSAGKDYNEYELTNSNQPTEKRNKENKRNKRNLAIADILSPEQIRSKIQDLVLFEGLLHKYKPGISIQYISRWCQVTKNEFMYFKNQWGANCWLTKPIIILPLIYIQSVQRVQVITRKHDKKLKIINQNLDNYQFEIFLKDEIDLPTIYKGNNEYTIIDNNKNLLGLENKKEIQEEQIQKESKIDVPLLDERKGKERKELVEIAEENENMQKESLSPNNNPKIEIKPSEMLPELEDSSTKKRRKSHKKRNICNSRPVNEDTEFKKNEPDLSHSIIQQEANSNFIEDDIRFTDRKEFEQFRTFILENSDYFPKCKFKGDITVKNPSAWITSLSSIILNII